MAPRRPSGRLAPPAAGSPLRARRRGGAHIGLADLGPGIGAGGDGLHRPLGRAPAPWRRRSATPRRRAFRPARGRRPPAGRRAGCWGRQRRAAAASDSGTNSRAGRLKRAPIGRWRKRAGQAAAGGARDGHRARSRRSAVRAPRCAPPADRGCGRRSGRDGGRASRTAPAGVRPTVACVERGLLGVEQVLQAGQALVLDLFRNLSGHGRGRRAGAAGIFEREGRGVADLGHQLQGGLEIARRSRQGSRR